MKLIGLGGNKRGSLDTEEKNRDLDPNGCGECQEPVNSFKHNEDNVAVEGLGDPGKLTYSSLSDVSGYEDLRRVLEMAYNQAARGKGKARHADGRAFVDQPIMLIQEMIGPGFGLGQACKKLQESQRLDWSQAQNELLGAIVYIAAAYLHREKNNV